MSNADKMFEKLGYIYSSVIQEKGKIIHIIFRNHNNYTIELKIETKEILISNYNTSCLTFKELQAINEKVKELGWNE